MDKLTAFRVFGNSRLTPAKHAKVFNDRWYLVRMQNTERDQGDGYYLAEGEYVELLPGNKARERREARLNHCNGITEYFGFVLEGFAAQYGTVRSIGYFTSVKDAFDAITKQYQDHEKWIRDVRHEADLAQVRADAADPRGDRTFHLNRVADIQQTLAKYVGQPYRCDIRIVRSAR
jgi:hypothetical protein